MMYNIIIIGIKIYSAVDYDIMSRNYRIGLGNTVLDPKIFYTADDFIELVGKYVLLNYTDTSAVQGEFTLAA